jgi:MutS domain I
LSSSNARVQQIGRIARVAVNTEVELLKLADCIDLSDGQDGHAVELLRASLASYSGHLRHGAAWRGWAEVWDRYPWLGALYARWSGRRSARAPSLRSQYAALLCHAGENSLLFFEVGRFVEFYGPQRLLAVRALGLRQTRLRRACYAFTAGFPLPLCGVYLRRALRQGFNVVWVPQARPAIRDAWVRRPTRIHLPAAVGVDTRRSKERKSNPT